MTTSLVIVESPAKAKTINKYLGKDYHGPGLLRPCPRPAGQGWLGACRTMISPCPGKSTANGEDAADRHRQGGEERRPPDPRDRPGSRGRGDLLARAARCSRTRSVLKDKPVSASSSTPSPSRRCSRRWPIRAQIDVPLVDAYLARRALDYLVGFTLSPVLWRKLPGARSAGRVQSVALRLVCDREAEIERFIARGILADRRDAARHAARRQLRGAARPNSRASKLQQLDITNEGAGRRRSRPCWKARRSRVAIGRGQADQAQSRSRPSPPRRCSRRRRRSSASRPRAPCRSRSGSMKASTSAARPSA